MAPVTLTQAQEAEVMRLKAYFPYRICYGALSSKGEFESGAVTTKRRPNHLAREGWHVVIASAK